MRWDKVAAIVFTVLFFVLFLPGYISYLLAISNLMATLVLTGQLVAIVAVIGFGFKRKRYGSSIGGSLAGILTTIVAVAVVDNEWFSLLFFEALSILALLVSVANLVGEQGPPPTKWHMQKRLVEAMAKAYEEQQKKQHAEETKQEYRGFPGVNPYFDAWWWGEMLSYDEEQ